MSIEITPGVNHMWRVVKDGKVVYRTNSKAKALRVKELYERPVYFHRDGEIYSRNSNSPMTDDEIKRVSAAHEYCGEEEALNELWIAAQERELYRSATPQ